MWRVIIDKYLLMLINLFTNSCLIVCRVNTEFPPRSGGSFFLFFSRGTAGKKGSRVRPGTTDMAQEDGSTYDLYMIF